MGRILGESSGIGRRVPGSHHLASRSIIHGMTARRVAAWLLGAVLLAAPTAHAATPAPAREVADTRTVSLKVGGKSELKESNVSRVAVSDPDVADIRVGPGDRIEVTGRSVGTTQLTVWKTDGSQMRYSIVISR